MATRCAYHTENPPNVRLTIVISAMMVTNNMLVFVGSAISNRVAAPGYCPTGGGLKRRIGGGQIKKIARIDRAKIEEKMFFRAIIYLTKVYS